MQQRHRIVPAACVSDSTIRSRLYLQTGESRVKPNAIKAHEAARAMTDTLRSFTSKRSKPFSRAFMNVFERVLWKWSWKVSDENKRWGERERAVSDITVWTYKGNNSFNCAQAQMSNRESRRNVDYMSVWNKVQDKSGDGSLLGLSEVKRNCRRKISVRNLAHR